jgi:phosphatidylinositol kinase/protein kinase (PI-3  family)
LSIIIRDELMLWYLNYCALQGNAATANSASNSGGNSGTQGNDDQPSASSNTNPVASQPTVAAATAPRPLPLAPIVGEIVENPFERLQASGIDEKAFFARVQQNCELVMKRSQTMAGIREEEQALEAGIPLFQSVLDLISSATNPQKLAQMDAHWHPWF